MKHPSFILYSLMFVVLFSCNSSSNVETERLKSELELKEQQIKELENELDENIGQANAGSQETTLDKKKELRYLFYANGGMLGYFDDGSVVGCPKCDFMSSNILAMFEGESIRTYKVQKDGSLLVSDGEVLFPKVDENGFDHWPLIDYKWNEKVPQE